LLLKRAMICGTGFFCRGSLLRDRQTDVRQTSDVRQKHRRITITSVQNSYYCFATIGHLSEAEKVLKLSPHFPLLRGWRHKSRATGHVVVLGTSPFFISAEYLLVFIWLLLWVRCVPWVTLRLSHIQQKINTDISTVYPLYPGHLLISFYLANSQTYISVWLLLALFRCILVYPSMSYTQTLLYS